MIRKTSSPPRPTDAELTLLNVLWRLGKATVRDVHEALPSSSRGGYTTVLKMLQIMHEKGLVERDDSQRAHVYRPTRSREQTQRQFLKDLAGRLFDGSPALLAMQALGGADATSPEELERIRAFLDQLEGRES
ncbi:MAG: BlaI/MecI/CopY family transcriptional regulator [Gammaproteobacteria bacterium]|jgi:predicted transcriptional regulator